MAGVNWVGPLAKSYATSGWGDPRPARKGVHYGIDLRASVGTPIFAVTAGSVVYVDLDRKTDGGVVLSLDVGDGARVNYAHLSRIIVRPGAIVSAGQLLGYTGITARGKTEVQTGPHLHLTVRMRGRSLANYIAQFGEPKRWLSAKNIGQAVPAEPLWQMAYRQRVVDRARQRGVRLYSSDSPFSTSGTSSWTANTKVQDEFLTARRPKTRATLTAAPRSSASSDETVSASTLGVILCLIFVYSWT